MWLSFSQRLPDGVKNQRRATKHGIPTIPRIIKLPIIYIDFDQKKVDEANRKVMDYVLYGKE